MRLTRLLASLPVLAILVATGCADGPLEGVRPVKYVKIEDANATTTREPPPKQAASPRREPAFEEKASTATTSAASSTTESVEPDELITNAAGSKPGGKGGKPATKLGGSKAGPPTNEKCFRLGKQAVACCLPEPLEELPKEGKCPKGAILGGSCPKKKCEKNK